ncbi:MAG: tetraacyldisaccharide 4'-kinase [Desulfuromonas sp.]|nr:tetraacyldisaccharide 4'-kinase [Desulfuromonas sp.]
MPTQLALYYRRLATQGAQSWKDLLLLCLLVPWGWLYGAVNLVRAWLYRHGWLPSYRSPVPVISVGNIAVGGTGKTPLVDYLLRWQLSQGRTVAVISRGYGGEKGAALRVVCAGDGPLLTAAQCGDEPYLLALRNRQAIIIVAPKRADGIRYALEQFAVDLVLLDDGYQHLAVQRDLDLLLLDSRHPFGNGHLLPAGLLREFPQALQRADAVVMTRYAEQRVPQRCSAKPVVCAKQKLADQAYDLNGKKYPVTLLKKSRCVAFAGIANPDDFFTALTEMGILLQATLPLADHCSYGAETVQKIKAVVEDADILLTTEKDAVKLSAACFDVPCCAVPLTFELVASDLLQQRIETLFN